VDNPLTGYYNDDTSQVVSGVLVTADLTLTNGADTVNLVTTQFLSSSSSLGSSMLAMTTTAAGTPTPT